MSILSAGAKMVRKVYGVGCRIYVVKCRLIKIDENCIITTKNYLMLLMQHLRITIVNNDCYTPPMVLSKSLRLILYTKTYLSTPKKKFWPRTKGCVSSIPFSHYEMNEKSL